MEVGYILIDILVIISFCEISGFKRDPPNILFVSKGDAIGRT